MQKPPGRGGFEAVGWGRRSAGGRVLARRAAPECTGGRGHDITWGRVTPFERDE